MNRAIAVALKTTAIVTICCSLCSCQVYCMCIIVILSAAGRNYHYMPDINQWFGDLEDCAMPNDLNDPAIIPDASNAVEPAPINLPQSGPHPDNGPSLGASPTLDCTDPGNAGRKDCAATNRQNKPLTSPEGN